MKMSFSDLAYDWYQLESNNNVFVSIDALFYYSSGTARKNIGSKWKA